MQIPYVTIETLKALKDILRRYPDAMNEFLPFLGPKLTTEIIDVDGKVALCWILGKFGQCIEDAPYMLEKLIEDSKELQHAHLSSCLVEATFRLFFKRAPETKKVLAAIFQEVMTNCTDVHVKQRTIMLYRLLQTNVPLAK